MRETDCTFVAHVPKLGRVDFGFVSQLPLVTHAAANGAVFAVTVDGEGDALYLPQATPLTHLVVLWGDFDGRRSFVLRHETFIIVWTQAAAGTTAENEYYRNEN